jgi:cell division transport system permease protein
MSILGVTIVLFFVGIFGWLLLNFSRYTDNLKENVKMQVYLRKTATEADIDSMKSLLSTQPYTRTVEYIDKETAKARWLEGGDSDFSEFLDENPLPNHFDITLKGNYVQKDTMVNIKAAIEAQDVVVEQVKYPNKVVETIGSSVRVGLIIFAIIAAIFCILSIVLIDNTIRLAMYSNRFLIKTMQMVGATRNFIARPMNTRAIINGALSAIMAIVLIYISMLASEFFLPEIRDLRDNNKLVLLFLFLILLGISITLFSTYRSVVKYLKMKLDELY